MRPTLFLHIGHPKTGSSAFQACLAQASLQLKAAGILYPELGSFAAARRGHVNSGNLPLGPTPHNWLEHTVLPLVQTHAASGHAILFSNENLIHRMDVLFAHGSALEPYCHVHVLLAVRNPLEQLASVYQQLVKRHGYTSDFQWFLAEHDYRCNALLKSAAIVQALEASGIAYSLFNYSALRGRIVEALAASIGAPAGLLQASQQPPVNRSLSGVELQLLLLVNAVHGRDRGRRLADALVNQLPAIPPVRLGMEAWAQQQVEACHRAALGVLNARLPPSMPLQCAADSVEILPLHTGLSEAQLAVCRAVLTSPASGPSRPAAAAVARLITTQQRLIARLLQLLRR